NIKTLLGRGVRVIDPEVGRMACRTYGKGRLAPVETIVEYVSSLLNKPQDLKGRRVVVTAGPTVEDIDPVRFISNRSSGKMGFAAETENHTANGLQKLKAKNLDLIVVNPVSGPDSAFDSDTNQVTIIDASGGVDDLPSMSKAELADRILDRVVALLKV